MLRIQRNGYNTKNLITKNGAVEIEVPRDRNSSFAPSLVAKRQRRLDGFDDKVLSLYAKGMSLSDIKLQLQELYGADVSESLISQITDDVSLLINKSIACSIAAFCFCVIVISLFVIFSFIQPLRNLHTYLDSATLYVF
ncbi:transposase [Rickettsia felis]|uniref:transposase n=1 Tax=Rickettsia felis TaxID=42862 RepID=UPI000694C279|nr:transposase [Rickettsia felis]